MQYIALLLFAFVPYAVHAQVTLTSIVVSLTGVIGNFIKAGVAVALLVFIWGVAKTVIAMNNGGSIIDGDGKKGSGAGKAIEEGKKRMIWGVVGLFVIVSVWGIVAVLAQITGVSLTPSQPTPIFSY